MKTRVELVLRDAGGKTKTFRLTPGPEALMRVAREVRDPFRLAMRMSAAKELGPPDLLDVFAVLRIGLATSGYEVEEAEADAMFHAAGVSPLFEAFGEFVGALVNGGQVIEPPPEPEPDEPPAGAPAGANRAARRASSAKARAEKKAPARTGGSRT